MPTAVQDEDSPANSGEVGEFKVHYHIAGGMHRMDAATRNKAEAELLALLRELSTILSLPIKVESEARVEGGVVEYWSFLFQHREHVALMITILTSLLAAPFYVDKLRQSKQQTRLNELAIEKLRLEIAEKVDAALSRNQKQGGQRSGELLMEPAATPRELATALLSRKKIARRRSNYYERLFSNSKIEGVGFAAEHRHGAEEKYITRQRFPEFIIARPALEPLLCERVVIEVVSPVLRSGSLKWRGLLDKRVISFDLEDAAFRERVVAKHVQFQNGTSLLCDLEVHQREDETGEVEAIGYAVRTVHNITNPAALNGESIGSQLEFPLEPVEEPGETKDRSAGDPAV